MTFDNFENNFYNIELIARILKLFFKNAKCLIFSRTAIWLLSDKIIQPAFHRMAGICLPQPSGLDLVARALQQHHRDRRCPLQSTRHSLRQKRTNRLLATTALRMTVRACLARRSMLLPDRVPPLSSSWKKNQKDGRSRSGKIRRKAKLTRGKIQTII